MTETGPGESAYLPIRRAVEASVSELRRDITMDDWVIVASRRATRPSDFAKAAEDAAPSSNEICPFCPGNEAMTPPESWAIRGGTTPSPANGLGWQVRIVPNLFGAVGPEPPPQAEEVAGGMFARLPAVGFHEVVIETPDHNVTLGAMRIEQIELVLHAYLDRYCALAADARVELVVIFRNHGRKAGTSLHHPHSQVIASPVVPAVVRHRLEVARRYHDATGRSAYADLVAGEIAAGERIVSASPHFVVFTPFASRMPFETWIVPRRSSPSFATLSPAELSDLASTLRSTIARLEAALDNPPYNYVIQSAPPKVEDAPGFVWHLQIIPRVATAAGFELGSGMFINTVPPEDAAAFLRDVAA